MHDLVDGFLHTFFYISNQKVIHISDLIITAYDDHIKKDEIISKSLMYAEEYNKPISYIHPVSFKVFLCLEPKNI